jgi:hypothetical protein
VGSDEDEAASSVLRKNSNAMKITLAFDVYGTLVDPSGMAKHLADELGTKASEFADCWRERERERERGAA